MHFMLFNDVHCLISYIFYIWAQKLSLSSGSQDTSFFRENTIHNFFLRHSVFTIYVDWPQESTQTPKFIHHQTGPQYGGRCVGCAYFVNSDDPQILLVQLQVVWFQSKWIMFLPRLLMPPPPPKKKEREREEIIAAIEDTSCV